MFKLQIYIKQSYSSLSCNFQCCPIIQKMCMNFIRSCYRTRIASAFFDCWKKGHSFQEIIYCICSNSVSPLFCISSQIAPVAAMTKINKWINLVLYFINRKCVMYNLLKTIYDNITLCLHRSCYRTRITSAFFDRRKKGHSQNRKA